jgi:hypothetical protein
MKRGEAPLIIMLDGLMFYVIRISEKYLFQYW